MNIWKYIQNYIIDKICVISKIVVDSSLLIPIINIYLYTTHVVYIYYQ